jgi:HAD superfamily hydrolase (TIGR01509 family)
MLVIFDCDGVLVDSEPIANRILAELLTEHGLPTRFEESMREYRGCTQQAILETASARLGRTIPETLWRDFDARFFEVCERDLEAIPGTRTAVERIIAAGHPVCVASSGKISKMQRTLAWTGLLDLFEGRLFSATDVGRSKPHPDIFLHAADQMRAEPETCCVVEDSLHGVIAGVAAGMPVFGFAVGAEAVILSDAGACPSTRCRPSRRWSTRCRNEP